jgi:integrative and conjugative element protein (TIGR02256 family)
MIFTHRNGPPMELSEAALGHLLKHRQLQEGDPESGGVLVGRILHSGGYVVDRALGPNPGDRSTRYSFVRKRLKAQQQVVLEWEHSGGAVNYLGEWHTHPEPIPTPSLIDRIEWLRISRAATRTTPHLFFIIVGTEQTRVWCMEERDFFPTMMSPNESL